MTRRKIMFVATQTGGRTDGGLESATQVFESLKDEYEWTLLTTHETWFTDRWRRGGANVCVRPSIEKGRAKQLKGLLEAIVGHFKLARGYRPDLIHANDTRAFQVVSVPAAVLRRRILLTVRGTKAEGESLGWHWRLAARQCHRIVTLSASMSQYLLSHAGARPEKLVSIGSMVDLERYRVPKPEEAVSHRRRIGIPDGEFAVGCIGAVRDIKNQIDLIERALPVLRKQVPHSRLHCFGEYEPNRDEYARRVSCVIQHLGLQSAVVMHGHKSDMASIYPALDAVVIASRQEGLARAMIEGMATGLPIVSFDVCSAREILAANKAGIVVPQGDHFSLARALAMLAESPDLRREMGARGRAIAMERFSPAKVAAAYRALYEEALMA